jgi:hypothetical protein
MSNSLSRHSFRKASGSTVTRKLCQLTFLLLIVGVYGLALGQEAVPVPPQPRLGRSSGNIQIQLQTGADGRKSSLQITNGRSVLRVTDGAESIEIRDSDGRDIEIEHRRVVMGKPTVDKYKAADLETLRKDSPAGAKLYDTYAKQRAAIQVRAMGADRAIPLFGRPGMLLTRQVLVEQPDRRIEFEQKPDGSVHVKIIRSGSTEAELDRTFANFAELEAADSRLVNWYRQYVGTPSPE